MKRETALRHMNLCLDAAGLGQPNSELDYFGEQDAEQLLEKAAWWAQIAEALK
ncbi:hypothetical protein [Nocardia sp. NPDC049707]|uniref:hypothetical protein n=1 Tax=Nocardia sp. NPDC049707 TaxID=3154735 RepID=UPI003416B607